MTIVSFMTIVTKRLFAYDELRKALSMEKKQ